MFPVRWLLLGRVVSLLRGLGEYKELSVFHQETRMTPVFGVRSRQLPLSATAAVAIEVGRLICAL